MKRTAVIRHGSKYRYLLSRIWDDNINTTLVFIMLNPSKADAHRDDPTIKRLINFAKAWGYGGFKVINLFAFRSTKPEILNELTLFKAKGMYNDYYIKKIVTGADKVVCAWGNGGKLFYQNDIVSRGILRGINNLYHLGLTKGGYPKHPLYLKSDTQPILWERK